jgi:hypothetical protein
MCVIDKKVSNKIKNNYKDYLQKKKGL